MRKRAGFLEYRRQLPIAGSAAARIDHWNEFHRSLPDADLQDQAARCMNCGIPFCQAGDISDGVTSGCPIHNVIPAWNDLAYNGRWHEAFRVLALTNNFPEFTARVCPAPCESACVLGINDDPVTIKEIEHAIIERAFAEGFVRPRVPSTRTGKKVAIIGSGPAGLACGDELNQAGHYVTVFERDDRVGGLLMYGIPNMKLDKTVVSRRIDLLEEEGITFRTSTHIGTDLTADDLKAEFDAIMLCCGAIIPRDLAIEGRSLNGIHFAMDFLTGTTKRVLDASSEAAFIDVRGKEVIVIGGGDTGTDCIGASIRQGCRSVVQFEILSKPPERVTDHDAWLSNVRTFHTDYGQEEAEAQFGRDPRAFRVMTSRFLGDERGDLCGLETVEVERNAGGPEPVAGTEKVWPADAALLAMGFIGPARQAFIDDLGIELTSRGTIAVDENKATNVEGVFAAGDCERGQSLIVWAIADGRKAAQGVDQFLGKVKAECATIGPA